jgi:Tat protein secretion system quality control protein TatD with DNase activity
LGHRILQPSHAPLMSYVPMDRLFFESDAPHLLPRHTGLPLLDTGVPQKESYGLSSPALVKVLAEQCAAVRRVSLPDLNRQLWSNAAELLGEPHLKVAAGD